MMKNLFVTFFSVCFVASMAAAQAPIDLSAHFDADAVLESGGAGVGAPLDDDGRRVDAGTLPANYAEGSLNTTQDGRASFQFAALLEESLDAMAINGQTVDVPDGAYGSIDLALMSAPGGFGNPFGEIEFRYADGSSDAVRLGPVGGWFSSPSANDNIFYNYLDDTQLDYIVSFDTNFGDDDLFYLVMEKGNGNSGGTRFIDGTGYALYILEDLEGITEATLGVTVGNNFVISIATEFWDPEYSTTEGYTVLANSMDLYDGFEHRALGNLKQYTFDVSPFLAENTGELWILFTDATPSNGWGPFLQNISLFTGSTMTFEETLEAPVDASNATVYAMFQTDGGEAEKDYLYDNSASGPSNRGHRFADGAGSLTYRFDLPDDASDAKLTIDMANNFIVSLSGPSDVVRYAAMSVGSADENDYLIDDGGSIPGGDFRFADLQTYMIYQFDLPDDIDSAIAQVHVGNEFVIEVASGAGGDFQVEMDWVAESGEETHDNSNLDFYSIDLSPYLIDNSSNIVQIRLSDGVPADGWGPYLKSIVIVNQEGSSDEDTFVEVMNSMEMYGADIHNESNKQYYTIDLSSVLENNPNKEVFVKFTDASTGDGWGPGVFWMAVYSGEIDIQSDRLVFNDLKTTMGDPDIFGVNMLHRRYALDPGKTLSEIVFPSQPVTDDSSVYLMAATLNDGGTSVGDWMLHQ
ncbi:MAG: hypothetical protein JXR73_03010 [Candidatus Omnitrophica bacterium]|nr:hypothetical protein [Candidatus Omnitrophota bacterium]